MVRYQSQINTDNKIRQKMSAVQVFIRRKYTQNASFIQTKNGDTHELTPGDISCIHH